jgi:RNA 3'-terminal phosphate cyclase (ATP)
MNVAPAEGFVTIVTLLLPVGTRLQVTGSPMVEIDGSYGEGGGQILRTALALSCLFTQPFHIHNIRKGRQKPGLMPQHLTSVWVAQSISGAEVSGDYKGATELAFAPQDVRSGDYAFDIGTAGSVTLVLQTIIPPLLLAGGKSTVTLTGGTHVPFSPSFHYLSEVFAPMLRRLGAEVRLNIDAYGFYPRGGGNVRVEILPARGFAPLRLEERGELVGLSGVSAVGNLPRHIAERQREAALEELHGRFLRLREPLRIELLNAPGPGQGTFMFLRGETEQSVAGCTALGAISKRAEVVGAEAARELLAWSGSGAALDAHLADQLVLYLALADGESCFTTAAVTRHLLTNLWVLGLFREFRYRIEGSEGEPGRVTIW